VLAFNLGGRFQQEGRLRQPRGLSPLPRRSAVIGMFFFIVRIWWVKRKSLRKKMRFPFLPTGATRSTPVNLRLEDGKVD